MKTAILLVCFFFQLIIAQEDNQVFSRAGISGGLLINSNRNLVHQYWKAGKGFYLLADSPFYFGNIEAGMFFIPYKQKSPDVPDYNSYYIFLGFNKEINLPLNLSITSGLRFGSEFFQFSDNSLSSYESMESELAVDIFAKGKLRLYKGFHLNASADYMSILTNRPIRLLFLSAGLGYEFSMPAWMKEFLR